MDDPSSPEMTMAAATSWAGYPGSKAAAGVVHRIIGEMPPHAAYVEGFLGYGAVMRAKRPALVNVGVDADRDVIVKWAGAGQRGVDVLHGRFLNLVGVSPLAALLDLPSTLLYLDPPYLLSTRTRLLYRVEMETAEAHAELLRFARGLRCMVMISGYWSPLYAEMLHDWRPIRFPAMTRGGVREEWLWMNFPRPTVFHDPRFCGSGFRERERVKRRRQRWVKRLASMKPFERQIIREALTAVDGEAAGGIVTGDVSRSLIVGNGVAAAASDVARLDVRGDVVGRRRPRRF